jgi:hypothetical protein
MENRHLHFNILTGVWTLAFLAVAIPASKIVVKRVPLPGLQGLWTYAFGAL